MFITTTALPNVNASSRPGYQNFTGAERAVRNLKKPDAKLGEFETVEEKTEGI